jgi:hypothetical protein
VLGQFINPLLGGFPSMVQRCCVKGRDFGYPLLMVQLFIAFIQQQLQGVTLGQ